MKLYQRPRSFAYNLVVIGAGAAGLVAAYTGAAVRARVALIEKDRMGGDCLNHGCVPSKALIRSARMLALARRAREFGFNSVQLDFNFSIVMERVQNVVSRIAPHDSMERYRSLGVDCHAGHARILTPYAVAVNDTTLTTANIIIAAGSRPAIPAIPGIENTAYLTTDTIWSLRDLPVRLLVLGGGAAGLELAQCFARFGSRVTLIESRPRILASEDPEISSMLTEQLQAEGIRVLTGHQVLEFSRRDGEAIAACRSSGARVDIAFDKLLLATGRKARTENYGLEELEIPLTDHGYITTDAYLRTCYPNIYACGDVSGPYQFTHMASYQARHAAVNALYTGIWKSRTEYKAVPRAVFTEPEVARVGLNEQEAVAQNIDFECTRYDLADLDRAIADEAATGMVKVLTVPGRDRILGAMIAGEQAGELITEFSSAMRNRYGMNRILNTIHIYPTLAEASRYTAGAWKLAHAPAGLLRLSQLFHRWRRK
jgi:pyruvate/2-oxoglutarate dehydrogenase complex dihydrolipoamide dehydrogenase (E3) component